MRDVHTTRWLIAAFLSSMSCNPSAARPAATQLLSITNVGLNSSKSPSLPGARYIASFDIRTWGVRILAVCHIPAGWTISAGKNANPEGTLSGSAGEGVAFIGAENLHQLTNLVLVQIDEYHPFNQGDCSRNCTPATFAGNLFVGQYGQDDQLSPYRILPSNIRLVPASHCPDPT